MTECPKCQSYISNGHCKKCEEDFIYKFGLEVSRRIKREAENIEWLQKPSSKDVGIKK